MNPTISSKSCNSLLSLSDAADVMSRVEALSHEVDQLVELGAFDGLDADRRRFLTRATRRLARRMRRGADTFHAETTSADAGR